MSLQPAFLVLLVLLVGSANAVTWDLKNRTTSEFLNAQPRDHVDPFSEEAQTCLSPGTCKPFQVEIPLQTVFSWCGWKTIYRSRYYVDVENKSSDANFSVILMREDDYESCNLSNFKKCRSVAYSLCDTKASCGLVINGLAFSDDLCLLVAVNGNLTKNKGRNGSTVTFRFYNYYESPRYYGVVFSIIMSIILFGSVLVYMSWTCYKEYNAPNDRIHEYRSLESCLLTGELAGDDPKAADAQEERKKQNIENFSTQVAGAMDKEIIIFINIYCQVTRLFKT
eukprot:gene32253-16819_t